MGSMVKETKKSDNVWYSHSENPYIMSQGNTSYICREMNIERRFEDRLAVNEGIYAVIESLAPQICQIRDMGDGGLSYVYFAGDEPVFESETIDILVTGFGFCL